MSNISTLRGLEGQTQGPVFGPADPAAAEEIAAFNTAIVQHPAAVIGAVGEDDVCSAIRWATGQGLPVAVQATGHGLYKPADAAVVISTRRMDSVELLAETQTIRVGAGVRWRKVIDTAQRNGLAPLSGSSSLVGAAGYALGGGVGLLSREFGFAADRIVRFTIVTADGEIRVVDADADPDLYWAVRGGKGNFGVVTEMELGLVPVTTLFGATVYFTAESTPSVLRTYATWAPSLPTNSSSSVALLRLPDLETLPGPLRGKRLVHLRYTFNGKAEHGEALLRPMMTTGEIVLERRGVMGFADADVIHQDPTTPLPVWERSAQLTDFGEDAVDALLETAGPESDCRLLKLELRQLGGALADQPEFPNAVAGRDAPYSLFMIGICPPGAQEAIQESGEAALRALKPWTAPTTLVNFLGAATRPEDVRAAWLPTDRDRLLRIKTTTDPDNVFRFGHALV
ncbi:MULTISPECIES: FAD-binding oxidoreductase [unclassified Nocardioides]|uniref:FAD-binding oxidoreductase n=1 Tax=unclassified Nocardioides TaxID=2615069 RepID=UPI0009F14937|nr:MULTISPECIES: FAD-binding oxidoreductase [unclassified Nocardioides]GAW47966.1 Mitomycin radical oxidase [Nocardioides sp. PD653-B2]GAW53731.1 Mitomycin radical oxidase [Nocardioides sp. PD653]